MSFLIVVLVVVLVSVLGVVRQIFAVPFPRSAVFVENPAAAIHPVLAPMFEDAHAALQDLGFRLWHQGEMRLQPAFLLYAGAMRLYGSADGLTLAQVTTSLQIEEGDRCQVIFYSTGADGRVYATMEWNLFNRAFVFPNREMLSEHFAGLAAQYAAHCARIAGKSPVAFAGNAWEWLAQHELQSVQWLYERGFLRITGDGAGRLTVRGVWRMLRHAFSRPPQSLADADAVPHERLVLLWEVWKKRMDMCSPTPLVQWGLFLFSALLFVALGSWYWSVDVALVLGGVIALHEGGHWLMMRALGYRRVHVMLLPFAGGVTFGEEEQASARDRAWVALAGPLPGIALGALLLAGGWADSHPWLAMATWMLIVFNLFNLLPVLPLDGGDMLQALLGRKAVWPAQVFCIASVAAVLYLAWRLEAGWFAVLALMPFWALRDVHMQRQWISAWQEYPEAQNDMQARIHALQIVANPARPKAYTRVMEAEQLLKTLRFRPMRLRDAVGVAVLWLACFAVLLMDEMRFLPAMVLGLDKW